MKTYRPHTRGAHADDFDDNEPCYCDIPKCNADEVGDTTSRCELHNKYHLFNPNLVAQRD